METWVKEEIERKDVEKALAQMSVIVSASGDTSVRIARDARR